LVGCGVICIQCNTHALGARLRTHQESIDEISAFLGNTVGLQFLEHHGPACLEILRYLEVTAVIVTNVSNVDE